MKIFKSQIKLLIEEILNKEKQLQKAIEQLYAVGWFVGDVEVAAKVFPQKYSNAFETKYKYDYEKQEAIERFYDYWNAKLRRKVESLVRLQE